MAQTDINLVWTGGNTGAAQAITSAAVVSTGILDLATGLMNTTTSYVAPLLSDGNATYFGQDYGVGAERLMMWATVGTTFLGGTSLNISIQGAVDTQGSGLFSALTFQTYAETGAIPVAALVAPTNSVAVPNIIPLPDWPRRIITKALPRFIQIVYTPVGTFSAGTINFAGMGLQRPDPFNLGQYASGFSVGP